MTQSQQSISPQQAASAASAIELTILLPALNEAETLETCIRKATDTVAREGLSRKFS